MLTPGAVIPSLASARDTADSFKGHARSCKKALTDCSQCTRILGWYGALPLPLLAQVLVDRPAVRRSL